MSENRIFYVYVHRKKTNLEPFYVGKGHGRRAWESAKGRRSAHWYNTAQKHGVYVEMYRENMTEDEAFALEIQLIASMREAGYALVNKTNGGEGTSGLKLSPEHQQALLNALIGHTFNLGRKHTQESRLRMREATKKYYETNPHPWVGKSHTPMTKELIASRLRGRQFSSETKQKMRAARLGKVMPEEVRDKIRQANSGENAVYFGVRGKDHPAYGLCGAKNPMSKPILCVETGVIFESSSLAAKHLRENNWPKASHQPILSALNKPNRTAYGYHWKSAND